MALPGRRIMDGRVGARPRGDRDGLTSGDSVQRLGHERDQRVQQAQQDVEDLASTRRVPLAASVSLNETRRARRTSPHSLVPGEVVEQRPQTSANSYRSRTAPPPPPARRCVRGTGIQAIDGDRRPAAPATRRPPWRRSAIAKRVAFQSLLQKLREPRPPLLADRASPARTRWPLRCGQAGRVRAVGGPYPVQAGRRRCRTDSDIFLPDCVPHPCPCSTTAKSGTADAGQSAYRPNSIIRRSTPEEQDVAAGHQHRWSDSTSSSSALSSGQPSVENGHSAEREPGVEHVGSCAPGSSCRSAARLRLRPRQQRHERSPSGPYQAGMLMAPPELAARCTTSCDVVHPAEELVAPGARARTVTRRPHAPPRSAAWASFSASTYHCIGQAAARPVRRRGRGGRRRARMRLDSPRRGPSSSMSAPRSSGASKPSSRSDLLTGAVSFSRARARRRC